ncbi:MAG: replication-associated recombination protein A [Selenomonas sp.]|uniref:replication-associated recombination protein A n=1 Tax=Selenomonas sp. TaxID=2053611 RepID=UPI0025D6B0D1|nr:replication-associated recombination protein A [Selenomonas sp.]MCR5757155.1 replication-associated recombination protein A [Selenomonas sp.]
MAEELDLFAAASQQQAGSGSSIPRFSPLAQRMRPRNFQEFVGQQEAVGGGRFLRQMIEKDQISSMIFYGPPGTGKTTLAQMIAGMTGSIFKKLNAVAAGIADIRQIVKEADEARKFYQQRTIVFIDEIHRFNKSQQDVLLPYVEDGRLILIGATTENPFFEVNHALLSRVRIVRLYQLTDGQLVKILKQALLDKERGLGNQPITIRDNVILAMAQMAGGDARMALNILEGTASMLPLTGGEITLDMVQEILGQRVQRYDKTGDNHYDTVSAFIKSMRGSDPDAALHYLARMIAAGEDVKFIARRVVICAAEDVGNADPMALVMAMNAANAVQFIGMPEARIILGQAVTYIASAPKSNAAYLAIDAALQDVRSKNCGPIPLHLRDAHYKGAAKLGHGTEYIYPHDYPGHFQEQAYLPQELQQAHYYEPSDNGQEKNMGDYLRQCWPKRF